jgi:hypothetical protein
VEINKIFMSLFYFFLKSEGQQVGADDFAGGFKDFCE